MKKRISRLSLYFTIVVHLCFVVFLIAPWVLAQSGAVTKVITTPAGTINVDSNSGTTNIGDVFNVGHSTEIQVNDSGRTITLGTTNGLINLTGKASADMIWTPTLLLTDNGTTVATNAATSNSFRVTALTASVTLSNPTNPSNGQRIVWEVLQNASSAKTLAFDTQFGFGAEITGCTISATLSSHNFVTAVYNSTTTKWYVTGCVTGY